MSQKNDNESKRLSVEMSKLNVNCQEFVPRAAMFPASIEGPSTSSLYRPDYYDRESIEGPSTSSLHRPDYYHSASIEGPSTSSLYRSDYYHSASIEGPSTSSVYRSDYYNNESIAGPSTSDLHRPNYYDGRSIEEPSTSNVCRPTSFDDGSIAGPSTSTMSRPAYFERAPSSPSSPAPSCSRYDYEHAPVSLGMPPLMHNSPVSSTMPSPEESNPTPGPSFRPSKTSLKKRRKEDIEDKSIIKKKYQEKKSLKEHINIVLVGHVDAGKSTIGGQIMSLTGMVDVRTLQKYQEEAREISRESWYLAWALDTNDEEREKGKTVEVGRAYFETETKHITVLDAPGHKSFVPNMIGGAAQADLAILVISARKGEFETGFEKGGQTREHAMLVKSAGVKHIVAVITKMDDPTVNWDETRFTYCKETLMPFLKQLGYKPEKDLSFIPVSGLTGEGLLARVSEEVCPWYTGPSFIELIDELPSFKRNKDGPFVLPIVDKYKDMGTVVMGKVESGSVDKGSNLLLMPNKVQVIVDQLWSDNIEVTSVSSGENVKMKLKGIEEEDVSVGFVLCDIDKPVTTGKIFDAQVVILETKSIICAGYSAVMHVHCAAEHVTVKALICLVDKKTGEKSTIRPRFVKQGQVVIMRIECAGTICMEALKTFEQLGRISLRDERENKTIAIGKILKVIK